MTAVNDGMLLQSHLLKLIKRYFGSEPTLYMRLLELFNEVTWQTELGQVRGRSGGCARGAPRMGCGRGAGVRKRDGGCRVGSATRIHPPAPSRSYSTSRASLRPARASPSTSSASHWSATRPSSSTRPPTTGACGWGVVCAWQGRRTEGQHMDALSADAGHLAPRLRAPLPPPQLLLAHRLRFPAGGRRLRRGEDARGRGAH